jgi:urea transporter
MRKSILVVLRGVGQVMLQNNAATGLLFLVGIFYNSWLMGLGAIIGNVVSTVSALIFKYPKEDIDNGLYGFNGTLVGIALFFFFGLNSVTVFLLILGAILSTTVMRTLSKIAPAFTAPFVISTWVVILGVKFFNLIPFLASPSPFYDHFNLLSASSMGFGQVMFQGNIVTGILFLIAIAINSRKSALYALYGTILGFLFALLLSFPLAMINIGLFGYNAVLCGVALGDKKQAILSATIGIILSVLINFGLNKSGIITLTAPFVLATWMVLFFIKKLSQVKTA